MFHIFILQQVIMIGTFAGGSEQVELGLLIQRQTCVGIHAHLDMLYDCQPGRPNLP